MIPFNLTVLMYWECYLFDYKTKISIDKRKYEGKGKLEIMSILALFIKDEILFFFLSTHIIFKLSHTLLKIYY